jgi:hypothetical protein
MLAGGGRDLDAQVLALREGLVAMRESAMIMVNVRALSSDNDPLSSHHR